MKGNLHVRFGGRRLETQVKLCAGRLPYDVAVMLSKVRHHLLFCQQYPTSICVTDNGKGRP